MTSQRDTDRLIRAFLAEGQTDLPDQIYDVVRREIDRTNQRVVIGPWRMPFMNNIVRIAVAAAAVLIVVVVGINLLPGAGGPGGLEESPNPTATQNPTPTAFAVADPCALLTEAEVAEAVHLAGGVTSSSTEDGRYCFYTLGGTDVLSFSVDRHSAATGFAALSTGSGAEPVLGLGDGAVWLPTRYLAILKGDVLVQMRMVIHYEDPATQLEEAKAAGAIIAGRL